jgi:tRNA pseudouridine38-40 synthase
MKRIVLGIEYDGTAYAGWQWQTGKRTVQSELQAILSRIANQEIRVICAGRTDAGVHALEQVVHFDTDVQRDLKAWVLGANSLLPEDIRVTWAQPAQADFHARYSAVARFYRYVILNRPMKSALLKTQATWCYLPLDAEKMQLAAQYLIGEHDFTSYRAQGCQSKSPFRLMHFIEVYRRDEQVIIDICANAFLHHMVRNIAGVLMEVGMGRQPIDWPLHLLEIKDRAQAAATAPPHGLHLGAVYYPEQYALKQHPIFVKLPKGVKRFD